MNIIFLEHKLCEDFVFKNVLFELIPRSSMKQNQNDNKITLLKELYFIADQIKKSYRKLALKYHPDKVSQL